MKHKTFPAFICLQIMMAITLQLSAQVPQLINYQARLTYPPTNLPVADGVYTLTFSIYDVPTGGTPLWTEIQSVQTANGIYSVLLGSLNALDVSLFSGTKRYLGVAVGTDPEMAPRKQMASVPFALLAKKLETAIVGQYYYIDKDADGYGDFYNPVWVPQGVEILNHFINDNNDCNDNDSLTHPGAAEILGDGIDQDCDGNDLTGIWIDPLDGYPYKIVVIGTQIWIAENLRSTKLNDGTSIPLVNDSSVWTTLSTPAYCYYNNDQTNFGDTYGALYNWFTVNTGKLCPAGWHVPSNDEWWTLVNYLGGWSVAGGKMKETGIFHWLDPNVGATNESGFTGLPGGYRRSNAIFAGKYAYARWWASTPYDQGAGCLILECAGAYCNYLENHNIIFGNSVRCIKD